MRGELPTGQKLSRTGRDSQVPALAQPGQGVLRYGGPIRVSFLVTGSARLDHYRKGGDSLQGRYHYYRLHPVTLGELGADGTSDDLEQSDAIRRFSGTSFRRRRADLAPVATRESIPGRLRRPARPRERPRSRTCRTTRRGVTGTCRFAALGAEPAGGSPGRPRDRRALVAHPREPLHVFPHSHRSAPRESAP